MKHLPIQQPHYQRLLEEFTIHIERLGYNKSSQTTLPSQAREFLYWLEQQQIYRLEQVTLRHIQEYYKYLGQRPNSKKPGGLSNVSLCHHHYAIKLFFNHQEQTGNITDNPASGLTVPKPRYPPRQILNLKEIEELYETCEDLRDRAMLGLFYGCGLRRKEAIHLNIKDIHFKRQVLYVRQGKGGKRRAVPMTGQVTQDLKNYHRYQRGDLRQNAPLYFRGKYRDSADNKQAFILSNIGQRATQHTFYGRIKYLLSKTGIEKNVNAHSLRHSIATHLLENGMTIEYVRDFLGHKFLETTQIYLGYAHTVLTFANQQR